MTNRIGLIQSYPTLFYILRMWLSGRASPCQGEGREFESRHPLQILLAYASFLFLSIVFWLLFLLEYISLVQYNIILRH